MSQEMTVRTADTALVAWILRQAGCDYVAEANGERTYFRLTLTPEDFRRWRSEYYKSDHYTHEKLRQELAKEAREARMAKQAQESAAPGA